MSKRLLIILVFLLAPLTKLEACQCAATMSLKKAQRLSFERAELVFVGEVIGSYDRDTVTVKVVEALKGTQSCQEFKMARTIWCKFTPLSGLNLIYANHQGNTFIEESSENCGLSRSFYYPYVTLPDSNGANIFLDTGHESYHDLVKGSRRADRYRNRMMKLLLKEICQIRKWVHGNKRRRNEFICSDIGEVFPEIY